jgi:hypothetical protein
MTHTLVEVLYTNWVIFFKMLGARVSARGAPTCSGGDQ